MLLTTLGSVATSSPRNVPKRLREARPIGFTWGTLRTLHPLLTPIAPPLRNYTEVHELTAEQLSFGVRLIDAINEHTLGDSDVPYPAGWLGIGDASAWILESKITYPHQQLQHTICHTLHDPVLARKHESRRLHIATHSADPMHVTHASLGSLTPEQWHTLDCVQDTTPTDAKNAVENRFPKPIPAKPQAPPRAIDSKLWEESPLSPVESKDGEGNAPHEDDTMEHSSPQNVSTT